MASAVDIHHSARRRSNKESIGPLDQEVSCNVLRGSSRVASSQWGRSLTSIHVRE
jgi:hypothetical protein